MAEAELSTSEVNISIDDPDICKEGECDSDEVSLQSSDGDNAGPREGSDGEDRKRKKRRRGRHKGGKHHRKWKPYTKLSWSERKQVDARESIRANQKREEAFASGHPVAPYNTTQFLIEDHIKSEVSPYLNLDSDSQCGPEPKPMDETYIETTETITKVEPPVALTTSNHHRSSAILIVPDDEEERFLEKEFAITYDSLHLERLRAMSKEELVQENLELEKKVERMERQLAMRRKVDNVKEGDRESSDANSLGSSSEEFIDLANVKRSDGVESASDYCK